MTSPLENVETLIFCDETKFNISNGDIEDAIYYFGISVPRIHVAKVGHELKELLQRHNVQADVFHSTKIFRESRPRPKLMDDFTQLIIRNCLRCFCHKYTKNDLFEPTKFLQKFNNNILDFTKLEFQALFYFITILNTYLRDIKPRLLKKDISMFFDRNVYGINEIESFNFPSELYVLKQMTFSEKSRIMHLCLPDFFGYVFRKSKISQNKVESGDYTLETSPLTINSYKNLLEINSAKLFDFMGPDLNLIKQALERLIS